MSDSQTTPEAPAEQTAAPQENSLDNLMQRVSSLETHKENAIASANSYKSELEQERKKNEDLKSDILKLSKGGPLGRTQQPSMPQQPTSPQPAQMQAPPPQEPNPTNQMYAEYNDEGLRARPDFENRELKEKNDELMKKLEAIEIKTRKYEEAEYLNSLRNELMKELRNEGITPHANSEVHLDNLLRNAKFHRDENTKEFYRIGTDVNGKELVDTKTSMNEYVHWLKKNQSFLLQDAPKAPTLSTQVNQSGYANQSALRVAEDELITKMNNERVPNDRIAMALRELQDKFKRDNPIL